MTQYNDDDSRLIDEDFDFDAEYDSGTFLLPPVAYWASDENAGYAT